MRRIVMFNRVSADGFFASTDGKLDWAVPDADLDKAAGQSSAGFDTILFGRKTYEMFARFWPKIAAGTAPAADPHDGSRPSPEMHKIATVLTEMTKLVFSETLQEAEWKNSRIVPRFEAESVQKMKQGPGKDIIIFGSGSIVSQLTEHRLIDEYQFVVNPVILGAGRAMIDGITQPTRVELVESKPYASGNVMLRYTLR